MEEEGADAMNILDSANWLLIYSDMRCSIYARLGYPIKMKIEDDSDDVWEICYFISCDVQIPSNAYPGTWICCGDVFLAEKFCDDLIIAINQQEILSDKSLMTRDREPTDLLKYITDKKMTG